jgi:hypothetical protein
MAWTRTPRPASSARSDDRPLGTRQQGQEGLGHAPGAVEVDGQVLLDRGTVAQVVEQPDASVVDQDVERFY